MILLLPFVLFLSIHFEIHAMEPLKPISASLHGLCLSWFTPLDATNRPENGLSRSFICGHKVTEVKQKIVLQKSGLYHTIVVSGGHFLFLESVLKWLAWPRWLRFISLCAYYLMTGLQPPGLRCLMQLGLASVAKSRDWRFSSPALCFYAGLLCLAVSADLWTSLSFWLSLSVSLALCFSKELLPQKARTLQIVFPIVLIYLFLIPFNFSKGYPHPLNLILGMILLYPFCLTLMLSAGLILLGKLFAAPMFFQATDILNKNLFRLLEQWTTIIPSKNQIELSIFYFWIYLLVLTSLFHVFAIQFRRGTVHE
jgi:ComEC/Rec2-related protein